jgi:uncharacterized protein
LLNECYNVGAAAFITWRLYRVLTLEQIKKSAEEIAEKHPVKKLSLFGSYAAGNATEHSDVDLLIEFYSPSISLFKLSEIKLEFESKLKTEVDLIHAPLEEGSVIMIDEVVNIYEQ